MLVRVACNTFLQTLDVVDLLIATEVTVVGVTHVGIIY